MSTRHGLLLAHISVLLFGMSGVIAKLVPQSATVLTGGRSILGAMALGLYLTYRKQIRWPDTRTLGILVLSGILLALHWISFYHSIKISSVSIGVIAVTTFPVMAAVLEPFVMREPWRWSILWSPILVILGTAIMLGFAPTESDIMGFFWGFLAAALYVCIHFMNKLRVRNMSGLMMSFVQLSVAGIILLPFAIVGYNPIIDDGGRDIILILILAVFCTAIAYSLFIESMRSIPARTTAVIIGLEPVYAISVMVMFFNDSITWRTVVGGLIIAGSVIWSSMRVSE